MDFDEALKRAQEKQAATHEPTARSGFPLRCRQAGDPFHDGAGNGTSPNPGPPMSALGDVVERIAIDATQFRFVLVYRDAPVDSISTETIEQFHEAATMMMIKGHVPVASYFGIPVAPIINGTKLREAADGSDR